MNLKIKIGIIGAGYVGLPLAFEFSKFFPVKVFDNSQKRVKECNLGIDSNDEIKLKKKKNIQFFNSIANLDDCNFFIITLPTPLNKKNLPNLNSLIDITKKLGSMIKKKDFVIYESRIYPLATNKLFVPILEKYSKKTLNKDFFVGYSPERVSPGNNKHKLSNIKKIVSGSNKYSLKIINQVYSKIIKAGTYKAKNIIVAEFAKILENTQRYINIALINEISGLCNKMNISTKDVVDAASTKWNFMKIYPGIVGGHCIAVDPLYLSYQSRKFKVRPEIIDLSHKINSNVPNRIINEIKKNRITKILILGKTFKENCKDDRNSGVYDIIKKFNKLKIVPHFYDPVLKSKTNINIKYKLLKRLNRDHYSHIVICVAHKEFQKYNIRKVKNFSKNNDVKILDLKSIFNSSDVNFQL